jgi:hypothetical protein
MKALVQLILNATAAGKDMLLAANAAAQKVLLGLGNVDNTSDVNKPVSTAQQTALNAKIGGSLGSTDNRLLRSDGTGGLTAQGSAVTMDDTGNIESNGYFQSSGAQGLIWSTGALSARLKNGLRLGSSTPILFAQSTDSNDTIDAGIIRASAGVVEINNGTTGTLRDLSLRNITASGLMCCGVYTFATVPSASSNTGKFLRISDRAQKHAYSDGTDWRFFGDDAIIS